MAGRSIAVAVLVACLSGSACGDDGAVTDGGRADAAADAGPPDDAPSDAGPVRHAPALLPMLAPCPDGFREAALDGVPEVQGCDPWPETGRAECPDGQMHLPGEPGCEPVAPPCPADGFPEGLPTDGTVVFVRAGAPVGGDGTRTAPLATLRDGVDAAPAGGTVAIAPGVYEGDVDVARPMTLWGGCLDAVVRGRLAAIVAHESVTVRGLRLESMSMTFVAVAASFHVEDALIVGAPDGVVYVSGTSFEIEHSAIRGVGPSAFLATTGATAVLRRVEMREVGGTPFHVSGASLDAERIAVHGLDASDPVGSVVTTEAASTVRIAESAFSGLETTTMFALENSQVTITDSTIATVEGLAPRPTDTGIAALDGSSVVFERIVLTNAALQGFVGNASGSAVTLRDVVVAGILPAGDFGRGQFLEVSQGASATLERVLVRNAAGFGVLATGARTSVVATDLVIDTTLPTLDGSYGRAIQVQSSAALDGTRVRVSGGREAGVVVASPSTSVTLRDLEVIGTLESSCMPGPTCVSAGVGIGVYHRGALEVERFLIADNALLGAQVALGGELDLSDGIVRGHPVGVNLQVPGYDVSRLTASVAYVDNLVNLDSSDLPVPAVGP